MSRSNMLFKIGQLVYECTYPQSLGLVIETYLPQGGDPRMQGLRIHWMNPPGVAISPRPHLNWWWSAYRLKLVEDLQHGSGNE